MSLRRAVFWVHLSVGAASSLVIFMMALTGVILTYEGQLNRWGLRQYRADPALGVPPLGLDELLERATGEAHASRVASATLSRDPRDPAVLRLRDGSTILANRFSGEPLGDGNTAIRQFLRTVLYWHRWFALEGEYRIIGRTFTATANLAFLFLLVSGLYLWWPSKRSRTAWRQVPWFRRGLSGRARNFNWHTVIGFWSFVPLVVIVASGATFSYLWAGNLVYWLAGDDPRQEVVPPVSDATTPSDVADTGRPAPPEVDLRELVRIAIRDTPGWQTVTVRLPEPVHVPVSITIDRGTGRQPAESEELLFERATGELVGRGGYPTFSRGHRIRRWLRFAHTGEVYGVLGQSVAGIASLGVAVMVWTGLAMFWRRFFSRSGRR